MSECDRTAARLAAHADGALPPQEQHEVDRHLAGCAPCRSAAETERVARTVVRARAAQLRAAPLPPGLRTRCEALARTPQRATAIPVWRARLVPLTLAALLLAAVAAAVLVVTGGSEPVLAAQVTADHTRCFREFAPEGSAPLEASAVEADLAARFGWDVRVPPSSVEAGIHLVHARRCLSALGGVPHLLYRVGGGEVSLYVLDAEARGRADVEGLEGVSRVWTRGDTTFVLVSSAEPRATARAATYLMQQAR